jgi:hypothetical protein
MIDGGSYRPLFPCPEDLGHKPTGEDRLSERLQLRGPCFDWAIVSCASDIVGNDSLTTIYSAVKRISVRLDSRSDSQSERKPGLRDRPLTPRAISCTTVAAQRRCCSQLSG